MFRLTTSPFATTALGLLLVGVASACRSGQVGGGGGGRGAAPAGVAGVPPVPMPDPCLIGIDTAAAGDTIRVAVRGPVGSGPLIAPAAGGARLVARLRTATLIEVDCLGRVQPGLSDHWETPDSGRSWRFHVAPGRTFAGGAPLDAPAVRAAWQRQAGGPAAWPAVAAVQILSSDRLAVAFDPPQPTPALLADPVYGILGPLDSTGTFRESGPFAAIAASVDEHPARRSTWLASRMSGGPLLRVDSYAGTADLRDALDLEGAGGGADVTYTREPAVVEYAERRAGYEALPLPWDRTYLLLASDSAGTLSPASWPAAEIRAALARDAVPGEARGAEPPFWWHDAPACVSPSPPPGTMPPPPPMIGYLHGDTIARALAERIVALARGDTGPLGSWLPAAWTGARLRVAPFPGDRLIEAVRTRQVLGVVVALPRVAPAGCLPLVPAPPFHGIPLVDTRPYLIHRRGGVAVRLHRDGTLAFPIRTAP